MWYWIIGSLIVVALIAWLAWGRNKYEKLKDFIEVIRALGFVSNKKSKKNN